MSSQYLGRLSYNNPSIPIRYACRYHLRLLLINHRCRLPRDWIRSAHPIAVDSWDVHSCGCADYEALETVAATYFEGDHCIWRLLEESVKFALGFEDPDLHQSCVICRVDLDVLTRHHMASRWILGEILLLLRMRRDRRL
jgi:hypothetical protein